jgi:hypothetical protein
VVGELAPIPPPPAAIAVPAPPPVAVAPAANPQDDDEDVDPNEQAQADQRRKVMEANKLRALDMRNKRIFNRPRLAPQSEQREPRTPLE